ncbi:tRNA pseudouridine(38-40) synthase TruA [Spiroplasma turonicum]|uniref:tRNA pseudouridine synthase A n=1 Tax=Spiroplasma turonicum TaxID=216946 RepID=A0A0K1P7R7_9MOLU|nr:tRNA pseudouridine(38-40) synthase TruA [Spiroplasma turonicum]AKU80239.1 tRNA pseudouridine synthase A [Spiroplasma turonicum]ALX71239.1 tRNA pseudouridine synthase A [Spiroplasma turonicum]
MFYFLMTISYDGTDFCGWVKQKNKKTIQGELESAISKVAPNSLFKLVGASKTDSGVHALDQKVWVELNFNPNIEGFLKAINKTLPIGIKILAMESIPKSYRVRNCKYKIYKYSISFNNLDILTNRFSCYIQKNHFDFNKLKEALNIFIGQHNFINFSGLTYLESQTINPIRKVDDINVLMNDNLIEVFFKAKGFIRYQIRMIMGASIAHALNKVSLKDIIDTLNMKKNKLPYKAEACGLMLLKIKNNK